LRILAPLSVVLVIASGAIPAAAGASVYVVVFAAFGALGTALPLLRDGERGIVLRVVRGGISPPSYLLQRAAAGAVLALTQLLPALLVATAFLRASMVETLTAFAALALTLWIASSVGILVAAMSRSAMEAGVLCGVALVLLLHVSGVFHTPEPNGLGATLMALAPFGAVHGAFLTMLTGGAVGGGVAGLAWAIALPAIVWAWAPRITDSLER
jgi:ABC-type polysaccharide/polyol phosphate export permease